jgi:hypothetical protein
MSTNIRHRASLYPDVAFGLTPALWVAFGLLFLTFGLGDSLSTLMAMHLTQGHEGNPVVASALSLGPVGLVLAKLAIFAVAFFMTRLVVDWAGRRDRIIMTGLLFGCVAIYCVITFSNLLAVYAGNDLIHYFWPNF